MHFCRKPVGMSIIIINNRSPRAEIQVLSVFSAKNPTVNDASVTMLFAEGGDDFWCSAEQQCATWFLHVSFLSVIPDNV